MSSEGPSHPELQQMIRDRQRISKLEDALDDALDRIDSLEARLNIAEKSTRSKDAKVRQIVAYAENLRVGDQPMVAVNRKEIKGTTGVSRRYSYTLVDDLPDDYPFIHSRKEANERQYGNLELDWDAQGKSIVVDFERLHQDPDLVNKFTTPSNTEDT